MRAIEVKYECTMSKTSISSTKHVRFGKKFAIFSKSPRKMRLSSRVDAIDNSNNTYIENMALSEERKRILQKISMDEKEGKGKAGGLASSKKRKVTQKADYEDSNHSQSPLTIGQVSKRK